jgi:hypothetical protein
VLVLVAWIFGGGVLAQTVFLLKPKSMPMLKSNCGADIVHHTTPHHTTPVNSTPLHSTPFHSTPLQSIPHHTTSNHSTPNHITPHHTTPHHHCTLHSQVKVYEGSISFSGGLLVGDGVLAQAQVQAKT